jgi:hypothetical protein
MERRYDKDKSFINFWIATGYKEPSQLTATATTNGNDKLKNDKQH